MFNKGDTVDGKYLVEDVCSDTGGMGRLLHVTPRTTNYDHPIVLKYCRETNPDFLQRFRREVRLLTEFQGNSKVVTVVDSNVDHNPPYFVMRFYPDGDLLKIGDRIRADIAFQEQLFNQMLDCVAELHAAGKYHRDIKPHNFLLDGDTVVVSDFGVSKELHSVTGVTKSSMFMGTEGYMPPEFIREGGFKNADAAGDVFMLGKSFYVLLTGRDPRYPTPEGIAEPLFAVIERCCDVRKEARYADLGTLKQRLTAAYDVILGRKHGPGEVGQLLAEIQDRLKNTAKFVRDDVHRFIDLLRMLPEEDRTRVLFDVGDEFARVLTADDTQPFVSSFLDCYRHMVDTATYSFSYAETIADRMRVLFNAVAVSSQDKVKALEIAIRGAIRQNRYAAMDTCRTMIISIKDKGLGMRVAEMLSGYLDSFVGSIEASSVNVIAIGQLLDEHKKAEAAKPPTDPIAGLLD